MTLKILGGEFGGRLLKAPKGDQTRPTTSMVRKAVFDILQPQVTDAVFLDLFSGSGAMGIEALSRGARQAIFVDSHREAIRCLKENLSLLKITTQAVVFHLDVFKALVKLQEMRVVCDIIYADPPYDRSKTYMDLISYLDKNSILKPNGILLIESPIPSALEKLPPSLSCLKSLSSRRYGSSQIYQFQYL